MRILEIVHGFPPEATGGSELYAEAHARELARGFGDDVHVFAREADPALPDYQVREERSGGIGVTRVNQTFRSLRSFEDSYRSESIARRFTAVAEAFRPEVAHVHHLTCLSTEIPKELAARRIPIVFTLHDYWMMCHRGQLLDLDLHRCEGPSPAGCGRCLGAAAAGSGGVYAGGRLLARVERRLPRALARGLRRVAGAAVRSSTRDDDRAAIARRRIAHLREALGFVDHFLSPSDYLRGRFVEFGIAANRISVSGYGVDPAPFATATRTAGNGPLRLGFVGSLMVSKGPDILLEAFSGLPHGVAVLEVHGAITPYHGDDSYRGRLAQWADTSGVSWKGVTSRAGLPAALSGLDLLVVPSIWEENSPFVVREAFLAGVPVLAARVGGLPELVAGGRGGLLFEPGDVEGLARLLTELAGDRARLESLRSSIPGVRTLHEDVAATRELYAALLRATRESPPGRASELSS